MRKIFESELSQLGDELVEMSTQVHTAISDASRALLTANVALAEQVITRDTLIDDLERELDERCIVLLARQQPVATDLRIVVSALRMSATLERMGDLARHIAEVARLRYPAVAVPAELLATFKAMGEDATRVARQMTEVLETRDLAAAAQLQRDDDELDSLHQHTFDVVLSDSWDYGAQTTVDVTLLGRYFERFGDHGVSIAKRIAFLVTGDFPEEQLTAPARSGQPGQVHRLL